MNAAQESHELGPSFKAIDRAARLIFWGLPFLGFVHALRAVFADSDRPELAMLDAVYLAGAYALAGFVFGTLVQALGTSSVRHLPVRKLPSEEPSALLPPAPSQIGDGQLPERTTTEIRQAIRGKNWDEARALLDAIATDRRDDPHLTALHHEYQSARDAARDDHLAQLDAARKVNDPDRVLELHQFLVPLLDAEARNSLETELSRWFLRLIHNRLRTGKIQTDVAHLAGRIAETFSHTVEGASLRASLPTLRRSAGLCPRCAQPYTGVADACPECLSQGQQPSATAN
jgi:hypothetical protein